MIGIPRKNYLLLFLFFIEREGVTNIRIWEMITRSCIQQYLSYLSNDTKHCPDPDLSAIRITHRNTARSHGQYAHIRTLAAQRSYMLTQCRFNVGPALQTHWLDALWLLGRQTYFKLVECFSYFFHIGAYRSHFVSSISPWSCYVVCNAGSAPNQHFCDNFSVVMGLPDLSLGLIDGT